MKNKRQDNILKLLLENENITIDEIAQQSKVSTMTIRRDLDYLQEKGFLTRYYGGAKVNKVAIQELSFTLKSQENIKVKQLIAHEALQFIRPNSSIYLDSGTTTFELAKLLAHEKDHTIICNDLNICQILANSANKVYCTGGLVEINTGSLTGIYTLEFLKKFNLDIIFLAANSISTNLEIETSNESKALVKEYLLNQTTKKILLCDASKINKQSLFKIGHLSQFHYIISDYIFSQDNLRSISNTKIVNVEM